MNAATVPGLVPMLEPGRVSSLLRAQLPPSPTPSPSPTPVPPGGADCGTFDLTCKASRAADGIFAQVVDTVAHGSADLIVATSTWWAGTDSVDPRDAAVLAAQHAVAPLTVAILVGGVLVAAIRMILSRKAEPLAGLAAGLVRFAVVSALGLTVLQVALQAGDALARQLLGDAANQFATFMRDSLTDPGESIFVTLLVALVAAVLSLVQWLLMALRQAGLLVLAAMLPLAASGPRPWLYRLLSWLAAMVAYKPAAAFIYYLGFTYLSSTSGIDRGQVSVQVTGVMVLLLAVLAMPVLLRFFSWSGAAVAGAGGGSAFVGAAGAAALYSGGRSPAVTQAAAVDATGPGSHTLPSSAGPAGAATGAGAGSAAGAAGAALGPAGAVLAAGSAAAQGAGSGMTAGEPDDGPTS